jgi:hypothetical protein
MAVFDSSGKLPVVTFASIGAAFEQLCLLVGEVPRPSAPGGEALLR